MMTSPATLRGRVAAFLLIALVGCTVERQADPAATLRDEAFNAVRQSTGGQGTASFDGLPQQVMPTIGSVCGRVLIESPSEKDLQARPFFYVRGQPVIVAMDEASGQEVADRCRRALTEVEEIKLLPTRE